jgi:uncharacterized repeat protein (TIGR01451 family)
VQASSPYTGASPLVNDADVVASGDTVSTNNHGTVGTPLDNAATPTDFSLTKTTTVSAVDPSGLVPYTLTVTNNGLLPSPGGAQVTDVLPVGVAFVSAPGCSEAAGTVTCDVGALAVGATKSFVITVRAKTPYDGVNPLVNTAEVKAVGDTNPGNNTGTATSCIKTDLVITKTTKTMLLFPGSEVSWLITTTNNGPAVANNAVVTDELPAGVTYVSAPGCTLAAGTVTCALGDMAVGQSTPITLTVRVNDPYLGKNPLVNNARVVSDCVDIDPASNIGSSKINAVPGGGGGGVSNIPTLSEWMMMLLAALMMLGMLVMMKRGSGRVD